jgi:hypothetical protein
MPRKQFVAFTRFDASDVNSFLMDQSVMVFASVAARTTAIPTPVEGMVTYLEDSNNISVYNGSAWVPLPVGSGGTGATTLTSGGYLKGAGTSAITSQSGIPAGDVTSGTFDKARMPAGSVLQVVSSTYAVQNTTTSTGYVSSGAAATITPRSTSSRILILSSGALELSGNPQSAKLTIYRGGTDLTNSTMTFYQQSGGPLWHSPMVNFVDSPNTTSATTYTLFFRVNSGSGSISMQPSSTPTNIALIEVQG